jgi:hypothetical protein
MAVSVPQNYVALVTEISKATGIPYADVAAQAYVESSFNATAVSSSNAQGWLQFLPSTYNEYAAAAGVPEGTEFDPSDEALVYIQYMKSLLKSTGGNLTNALSEYNSGYPANQSAAGAQYASEIEQLAGTGDVTVGSTGASTTSVILPFPGGWADPLNWPSGILSGVGSEAVKPFEEVFDDIKVHAKDWAIRFGLIILGLIVLYAGIRGFLTPSSQGPGQLAANAGQGTINYINEPAKRAPAKSAAKKTATKTAEESVLV